MYSCIQHGWSNPMYMCPQCNPAQTSTTDASGKIQEPMYTITTTTTGPEYMDGFADGYSRAWKECWEHMRQIAQEEMKDKQPGNLP